MIGVFRPVGKVASTEAELGEPCTDYYLTDRHDRGSFDKNSLRAALAKLLSTLHGGTAFDCTGATTYAPVVLRPCLVASLKGCFDSDASRLARVVFDLDGGVDATMPDALVLRDLLYVWLAEHLPEVTWHDEPIAIFGGAFADKGASLHVYFPGLAWGPLASNRLGQHATELASLDAELAQFGLRCDPSIHTSGLKYPFLDKWVGERYRGAAHKLLLLQNWSPTTWAEVIDACDPHVVHDDPAWQRRVSFPPPLKRRAAAAPTRTVVATFVGTTTGASDPVSRLTEAVPEWLGVPLRRRNGSSTEIITLPSSRYCPLKGGEHSTAGTCFVCVSGTGAVRIACHKAGCAGKQMVVEAPAFNDATEQVILERFNAAWAKLDGKYIVKLPVLLEGDQLAPAKVYTHADFIAETTRNGEIYDKKSYPKWWLGSAQARNYDMGIVFDPSEKSGTRYYNSYLGVDNRVTAAARELGSADLLSLFPNWHRFVCANICANEPELIDYLFNWFAHSLQLPHVKPLVAIVLAGLPGVGKGLCTRAMLRIWGAPHGVQINGSDLLSSYNAMYLHAIFLFVDETEQTEHRSFDNARVKSLITEQTAVRNEKYEKQYEVKQYQHIIMSSNALVNHKQVVPYQAGERRYFGMPCDFRLGTSHDTVCDGAAAELDDYRALAAIYLWLMQRDISKFVPKRFPLSITTWQMQHASFDPYTRYIYRVLCTASFCVRDYEPTDKKVADRAELLISTYVEKGNAGIEVAQLGFRSFDRPTLCYPSDMAFVGLKQHYPNDNSLLDSVLWVRLKELAPDAGWRKAQYNTALGRVTGFFCPSLETLRTQFVQMRGNVDARIYDEWRIE